MKPYDKSNSFMRRVTKRVSNLLPGTTWMNMLLGESQSDDDPTITSDNDHQPPVKKLCTPSNTFTNTNNRACVDNNSSIILTDNPRNAHANVLLPEISAVNCIPSTSKQSPKFISQTNSSLGGPDIGNRSCLKRKSDVTDMSNISRQSPKTAFNFASSTPTLITANKQSVGLTNLKSSLISDKSSTKNEFSTPLSTKLIKPRERESQSTSKLQETSRNVSSPSFRWDTFVDYGELSDRQKLFAQKSPLNCSHVMYGGNSARSTLSKILGNTPPIHRKLVIPISPTSSSGVRSTSSILLEHTSTKDKEIEENKFIIQPRGLLRHKADQKNIPIKIETTVKIVDKTPEKPDDKSNNNSLICSGRDTSRKLRANISKKARGCKSEELEMPAKVDLPNITLPVPVLPSIKLSNNNADDNEFTFNQPLTIEQFSLQIAEKTCRKKQKMTLKKLHNTSSKDVLSPLSNVSADKTSKIESDKVSISTNKISVEDLTKNNKGPELCKFGDISKDTINLRSTQISDSKLENTKPINTVFNSSQVFESTNKNKLPSEKSAEIKNWTCDTCWVSNDIDKINCVACQTPKTDKSQPPLKVSKSSTWTCETCWVPNKNEIDMCVACQTQKPGTTKKVVEQCSTWTCDACWVKNKSECACCISCGTAKQGSAPENKLSTSTQFKFGLVNNTVEKSTIGQFKFGFDSKNTDQSSSQFKFGSPATFNTFENGKSDASTTEFKFGMVNNKTDQSLGTFKFGIDSTVIQSEKKPIELSNSNNTDKPSSQFKFGFESKSEQHESQFKFGQTSNTSKPAPQYKFGSDNVETEKSAKQNLCTDSNKVAQSKNEMKLINNKNEVSDKSIDVQNKSIQFKFGDNKQTEKSTPQSSIDANCSTANTFVNFGKKNENLSSGKFVWDKKDKTEIKPIIFGKSQSSKGSTNTNQLVNGHSHSNAISNEGQKPGLIKTSQLFNFGSLAKQDQNLPDDQKKTTTLTFGSTNNDNKPFVIPTLTSSSFPNTAPVFGTSNSMFGNGPTTPVTLGSSALTPQFSFASMAPQTSNFSFSKTSKDNDNKPLDPSSNSLTSTTKVGFSFGTQSQPVFGIANAGGFIKPSIQNDDQPKNTPNNIFGQSSTKQTVKLDPNAPISINFTGGATTQFTAKPETTEQPAKRKILKPVRRIR